MARTKKQWPLRLGSTDIHGPAVALLPWCRLEHYLINLVWPLPLSMSPSISLYLPSIGIFPDQPCCVFQIETTASILRCKGIKFSFACNFVRRMTLAASKSFLPSSNQPFSRATHTVATESSGYLPHRDSLQCTLRWLRWILIRFILALVFVGLILEKFSFFDKLLFADQLVWLAGLLLLRLELRTQVSHSDHLSPIRSLRTDWPRRLHLTG